VVGERSGLTNQFLHPPTAGDSLELEMKYFPIKLSTDFFTCPGIILGNWHSTFRLKGVLTFSSGLMFFV